MPPEGPPTSLPFRTRHCSRVPPCTTHTGSALLPRHLPARSSQRSACTCLALWVPPCWRRWAGWRSRMWWVNRKIEGRERSVDKLFRSANGARLRCCLVIGTCAADRDPGNDEVRCETAFHCRVDRQVIRRYHYFDYECHKRIWATLLNGNNAYRWQSVLCSCQEQ